MKKLGKFFMNKNVQRSLGLFTAGLFSTFLIAKGISKYSKYKKHQKYLNEISLRSIYKDQEYTGIP